MALPKDVIAGQDFLQVARGIWASPQEWLRHRDRWKPAVCASETASRCLSRWVQQPQVQVDESPWLVKGVKELWAFTGTGFCLFHAADTRFRRELEAVWTAFCGRVEQRTIVSTTAMMRRSSRSA